MKQYLDFLKHIQTNGVRKSDRTGTGTTSVFGQQLRFDLSQGFPLVTTKKVHTKSVIAELLWMLSGSTNVKDLQAMGCTIWDEWRQPYSLKRKAVMIAPRTGLKASYTGDFSTAGFEFKAGTEDRKLADTWVRMMRRCYDVNNHRYALYGACGATVHPDWHNVETFVAEAKQLPHWEYKQAQWGTFELDKDYFGAGEYGKNSSVWLRTDENNKYTKACIPVNVTQPCGTTTLYMTLSDAAEAIGMPNSTLCRFIKQGVPTMLKGNNKVYLGYEFEAAELDGKLLRLALYHKGELGPVYGHQWRSWAAPDGSTIDQISEAIKLLKTDPDSRRILVSAWNVADLPDMALAPCHCLFQFYTQELTDNERVMLLRRKVSFEERLKTTNAATTMEQQYTRYDIPSRRLSCQLYQRSADAFLGVPFNIASYALLTHMMAQQCNMAVGDFIWTGGDCHIYSNHQEQVKLQLSRDPQPLPKLNIKRKPDSIFDYKVDDFEFEDYVHHPTIKADVAV